ncbi:UNVERIFIED_CONTAM: Upstream activation factor subunit spp27 [Sesamum indicum]
MASSARVFGHSCRNLMAAAKSSAASTAAAAKPKTAGRVTGILKVQPVSPALAKFLGSPEASRSGAVKKIWEYVKSHNLQVRIFIL